MSIEKVFVDPNYNSRNRKRIEEDEKELETLIGKQEAPKEEEPKQVDAAPQEVEEEISDTEEKSFKKRYGDLRRHMSEKEKEWEAKFTELKASPDKRILPPKSDEDIAAWASKYPDVAAIVETIATKKADEKLSVYKQKFEEYEKVTYENTRDKAMNDIRASHDDFDELRRSDAFHVWVEEQPKWVQDALYENEEDAKAVIRVLDLYKSDKGLTPSGRKEKRREAASSVNSKSKARVDFDNSDGKIYESQVASMNIDAYGKSEAKIMEAIRKGNFVYDVSGAAR